MAGIMKYQPQRRQRLRDIEPYKVDLVDRAANKRKFLVCKEDAMSGANLGPELIVDGDELYTDGATDLERAATALENMTSQIGELVSELRKEQASESTGTEKASGALAATFREVAERAMSLAKMCEGETDMKKVFEEASALIGLLKSVLEKYPKPIGEPVAPAKAEDSQPSAPEVRSGIAPGPAFRELAEMALSLSGMVPDEPNPEFAKKSHELVARFASVGRELNIEKAEAVKVDEEASAATITQILREIAERMGVAAKIAGEDAVDTVSDAIAAELRKAWGMMDGLCAVLPVQTAKAASRISTTLREVAARAMSLASEANRAGFNDSKATKELKQIVALIGGLIEKYPNAKKADDLELTDIGALLSVEHMLGDFEAQLRKHDLLSRPSAPEPASVQGSKVETAKAPVVADAVVPAATVNKDAPESAQVPAPGPTPVDIMLAKMETMQDELRKLRGIVAKARGEVPPPASIAEDALLTDDDPLLFPSNYNAIEYREAVERRSRGEN